MQRAGRLLAGIPWPLLAVLALVVALMAAVPSARGVGLPWRVAALALVGVLSLAEMRWPARPERAPRPLNLTIWGALSVLEVTVLPFAWFWLGVWITRLGVPSLRIDHWAIWFSFPLLFVTLDLCEYAYHRAQHAVPWLWERHALHHSDPCITATTTQRYWWGDLVLKAALFGVPVAAVLRPSELDYSIYATITLYNYFQHANLRVDYGRWSWLLTSPAYHRLHHARDPRYYGANYAFQLPIFDVILGSYRRPSDYPETGLDEAPQSVAEALAWPRPRGRPRGPVPQQGWARPAQLPTRSG